ncbi:flagellar filament capping protein FliD [Acerihabitans sp. TG2]|uniref:flagellar filament capping protein FliD n=1 Tax=Acerihabitans sp. TG2 TaxID=3096008 RepID=UPI002B22E78A|nr:flagellar filament capping protein FliD [Acerihabitans sp. TG2]MEA9392576.1 flagellar filament capping protein FliD [Acerihabitans sp. TG2]
MTTAISSLGVGSGLDLGGLLDTLQASEEKRLTPITTKQTSYNAKLTAYGTLTSALSTFSTASKALTDPTLYTEKVASTNDGFTTKVGTNATSGSYSISVQQLAAAQSLSSSHVFTDTSTPVLDSTTSNSTAQSLSIQVGTATAVKIPLTAAQTSLTGMRDAINGANAGVTASLVQTGDKAYQLIVTSNTSGTSSGITMGVTTDGTGAGDTTLQQMLSYDGTTTTTGMTQTVEPLDAKLTFNGVAITRSSNTIDDVPQGVTLTLTAPTTTTQNLTVRQSVTDSTKAVEDWVSAYNTLLSTFNSLSQFTVVAAGASQSTTNGALVGDSVLSSVKNQIQTAISSAQSSSSIRVLNQVGITLNKDGTLATDETKLVKNLADNTAAVSAFFVGNGSTTGLASQMVSIADTFTSSTGVITGATNSINTVLTGLTKQATQVQSSIDANIARYKKQFTQLDVLVETLNNTKTFLTQQFNTMNNTSSSSS